MSPLGPVSVSASWHAPGCPRSTSHILTNLSSIVPSSLSIAPSSPALIPDDTPIPNILSSLSILSRIIFFRSSSLVSSQSEAEFVAFSRVLYSNTQALLIMNPFQATWRETSPGSWGGQKHLNTPGWINVAGTEQPSKRQEYWPFLRDQSPRIRIFVLPSEYDHSGENSVMMFSERCPVASGVLCVDVREDVWEVPFADMFVGDAPTLGSVVSTWDTPICDIPTPDTLNWDVPAWETLNWVPVSFTVPAPRRPICDTQTLGRASSIVSTLESASFDPPNCDIPTLDIPNWNILAWGTFLWATTTLETPSFVPSNFGISTIDTPCWGWEVLSWAPTTLDEPAPDTWGISNWDRPTWDTPTSETLIWDTSTSAPGTPISNMFTCPLKDRSFEGHWWPLCNKPSIVALECNTEGVRLLNVWQSVVIISVGLHNVRPILGTMSLFIVVDCWTRFP